MSDAESVTEFLPPADVVPLVVTPGSASVLTARRTASDLHGPGSSAPVWLVGEVDLATAADLLEHLRIAAGDRCVGPVVLDLSRVTFMDLAGLRMLLGFDGELAAQGRQLVLRAPSAPVRLLLRVTETTELTIAPGPDGADGAGPRGAPGGPAA